MHQLRWSDQRLDSLQKGSKDMFAGLDRGSGCWEGRAWEQSPTGLLCWAINVGM